MITRAKFNSFGMTHSVRNSSVLRTRFLIIKVSKANRLEAQFLQSAEWLYFLQLLLEFVNLQTCRTYRLSAVHDSVFPAAEANMFHHRVYSVVGIIARSSPER